MMSKKLKIAAALLAVLTLLYSFFSVTTVFAEPDDEPILPVSDETTAPAEPTDHGVINITMNVGNDKTLGGEFNDDLGENVTFSSNNTSVLSMVNASNGTIRALREGTATVKATGSKGTISFVVKVNPKPTSTKAPSPSPKTLTTLSGTLNLSVEKGKTTTLSHAGLSGTVTYRSGNSSIAKVSNKGVVTAVKAGTTYIQAYNNTHIQNYQITVIDNETETVTVEETTTDGSETTTAVVAAISDIVEEDTTPALVLSDTDSQATDHSGLRKKVLIVTAIIIVLIIVGAVLIYKRIAARNDEEYPVDFYPEDVAPTIPDDVAPPAEDYREFNFKENENGEVEPAYSPNEQDINVQEDTAEDFSEDTSFINDNPDESDDDTFLL